MLRLCSSAVAEPSRSSDPRATALKRGKNLVCSQLKRSLGLGWTKPEVVSSHSGFAAKKYNGLYSNRPELCHEAEREFVDSSAPISTEPGRNRRALTVTICGARGFLGANQCFGFLCGLRRKPLFADRISFH